MLRRISNNGRLVPMNIVRYEGFPSHLLFADDVLIFSKASAANAKSVLHTLNSYADMSNQNYNPNKSRIFFGSHAPTYLRRRINNVLHISEGTFPLIYLGVFPYLLDSKESAFTTDCRQNFG